MSDTLPRVTIYSDGGADPNPGPGGWGVVLLFEREGKIHEKELSGGSENTTNNRMELMAAIEALRALKVPCAVDFHADSQYVVKGMTEWMAGWLRTDFKHGKVENADLWKVLNAEAARHTIKWHWVRGHAGNEYNERADQLATAAIPKNRDEIEIAQVRAYMRVSCQGTTGGWAALIVQPDKEDLILTGSERRTTANRLDLLAVVAALEAIPAGSTARLFTASSYIYTGITQWLAGWRRNGWKKKTGGEVQNRELWERIDGLIAQRDIRWTQYADEHRPPDVDMVLQRLAEPLRQAVDRAHRMK